MRIISRKKYNRTVCLSHTRRRMAANPEAARRRQLIGEGHFALVISTRSQATLSPILTKSCLTPRIDPFAYTDRALANRICVDGVRDCPRCGRPPARRRWEKALLPFGSWNLGEELVCGTPDIPILTNGKPVHPVMVITPVVDDGCYTLGFGGGYFAAL
jgi:hypothetical protein